MANLRQKNQLAKLLNKLGDNSYDAHNVIDEILQEVEKVRQSIPTPTDLSPFYGSVKDLNTKYDSVSGTISNINKTIDTLRQIISEKTKTSDDLLKFSTDTLKVLDKLQKETDDIRSIALSRGGGGINRQMLINGTNYLTRFNDVNLISGSNVTLSASNNNTTKKVDITITSTGGGGGGNWTPNDLIGTGNDSTTVFTLSATPVAGSVSIYVGGVKQLLTTDYSISSTTITFIIAPPNGQPVVASYMT